jgi:high affinity sulfate transporter 1
VPAIVARRALAVVPGLGVLRRYERRWLPGDLFGGLTVGAMLIPQSMAYAELAGMPPVHGFYAAIGALVVYALVGTSRHLGVGPEPGTAILAATGVGAIAAGDPGRYLTLMAALALVVAAICVVAAVVRLGFVSSLLSKPVLVGYITGVGLTLLSSQIAPITGLAIEGGTFFPRFAELAREVSDVHGPTLLLGASALAVIQVLRRFAPAVPGGLVAVVGTALVVAAGIDDIALVGAIPAGLPTPAVPDVTLADLGQLLPVAAGIALVGFTDNLLTARSIAARHRVEGADPIDANQELLALGLTNLTAGLSQGFPVSSSASRTAVPASLGSTTQLVSLIGAGAVVASLTVLRPLLEDIPRPALAAVIVAAAIAIIDVRGFRELWRTSRTEAALAVVTVLGVIVFDVLVGVVVAVVLSVLVAVSRIARPHDAVLGDEPSLDGWVDVESHPRARTEEGLLVYRFDAPLFFVNADRFCDRVLRVLAENPGEEEWLVLDFEGVGAVDATAVDSLAGLLEQIAEADVALVAVARANEPVLALLRRAGLLAPDGPLVRFDTINSAVRAYRQHRADHRGDGDQDGQ